MDVPEPRLSLVTLGVSDLARARAFYDRFGFKASPQSQESVAFYANGGGTVLALFGRQALAEDAGVAADGSGFAGVALAWNVRQASDVAAVLDHAVACGARLVKPAQKVFWGGTSGYFADPDGHLWEVAFNPFWPLDERGHVRLPGAEP
jgi:catechol 2,3-dioxygenase-like lactoylglutathione lyase family enzyme